jgi:hypothetical protein
MTLFAFIPCATARSMIRRPRLATFPPAERPAFNGRPVPASVQVR